MSVVYGYIRVSSKDQNEDRQIIALREFGCNKLYVEKQSGKDFDRPHYQMLLRKLKPDDVLVVKSIDRATGRIYVTLRELLGTWQENADRFSPGQTISGVIRSVESYGVFVELAPNLAGLAELRPENAADLRDAIGKRVAVYIKSILPERMKIKLVLIDIGSSAPDSEPTKLSYYVDPETTNHISHWIYSPPYAKKTVETLFDPCD